MDICWIDEADELREFCEPLKDCVIAVDSESDHFHAYQAQVCLIQVATPEVAALIDPLDLTSDDLQPLFDVFEDPGVVKILHSARNDINEFDRDWGVGIDNLFDTQIAARFLGYQRNSLSWLVEEIVGEKPPGKFQRFDWTTRPIPEDARAYAAADVIHLFPLRDRFLGELDASQWLGPFAQQCAYVTRETNHEPNGFDPEGWRDIKQGRGLDDRGRAALRDLYLWRHELCSELNKAALHVFSNKAMAKVADKRPQNRQQLERIKGIPKPTIRHNADKILEVVAQSLDAPIPPDDRPGASSDDERSRSSGDQRRRYNALRSWRNETADELDIPPAFVATNATLTQIAADAPTEVADLEAYPEILPWLRQMYGRDIVRIAST